MSCPACAPAQSWGPGGPALTAARVASSAKPAPTTHQPCCQPVPLPLRPRYAEVQFSATPAKYIRFTAGDIEAIVDDDLFSGKARAPPAPACAP